MGTKLSKAPVYFTIAQIEHNLFLGLEAAVPTIQDGMRKAGYPDFGQTGPTGAQVYQFTNFDGTDGFILQHSSLSFQTTRYETFPDFLGKLMLGLQMLERAAGGLCFTERIGLRYLDAVLPPEGEGLDKYLVPELLGLPARLSDPNFAYSFTESMVHLPDGGSLTSRTMIQNGNIGFPNGLHPEPLKLAARFAAANQKHAVIDTDACFQQREAMSVETVKARLTTLHDAIEQSFRATVTGYAIESWR